MSAPPDRSADPPTTTEPDYQRPEVREAIDKYWRRNLWTMRLLMLVWALAGLGCGVLFADWLNVYKIGGFPLGFWFAQQGSIIVFVLVVLTYAILMNKADRKHHEDLEKLNAKRGGENR